MSGRGLTPRRMGAVSEPVTPKGKSALTAMGTPVPLDSSLVVGGKKGTPVATTPVKKTPVKKTPVKSTPVKEGEKEKEEEMEEVPFCSC